MVRVGQKPNRCVIMLKQLNDGESRWIGNFDKVPSVQRPDVQKYAKLGLSSKVDENNPVVVVIAPLRSSQRKILQQNFRKAETQFASVIEIQCLNKHSVKLLTVLRNNSRKAYMRLSALFYDAIQRDVSHISKCFSTVRPLLPKGRSTRQIKFGQRRTFGNR